ncbi:MAG TPA: hypothetical protein VK764_09030, partial [Terracidiphilus sp.]|nr:hypothetical protein [Terracidiphilus sp.]
AHSPFPIAETIPREKEPPMKLRTYLKYGGNCAEAFHFYEKHLGARIDVLMTHDQAPARPM